MTIQAESINSDIQPGLDWTGVYDTHNIEHRTEPLVIKVSADNYLSYKFVKICLMPLTTVPQRSDDVF